MDGAPIENYLKHMGYTEGKESYPAQFQWEYVYDLVTLTETVDGVEIRMDTLL